MSDLDSLLTELDSVLSGFASSTRPSATAATDDALLEFQRRVTLSSRLLDVAGATIAAEIAHRSRRELGYSGLAQRQGSRTPEALVQSITGTSLTTARRLIEVGTLLTSAAAARDGDLPLPEAEPWLHVAIAAAATGGISGEALEIIRRELGRPTEAVSTESLALAVAELTAMAGLVRVGRLATHARELRDQLDAAGVGDREAERRDRRYLRLFPQTDGMTKLIGLLDPESAAIIGAAIDVATSPRRSGPRFADPAERERAKLIVNDPRSTEQLALDAVVELVDVAVRSGFGNRLAARRSVVRVLVTQSDLAADIGVGYIEGQTAAISVASVRRLACDGGLQPILFDDDGQALNLGRTQRLHSARQRAVISARDGGCIEPGCDRPPSWTEVHHIVEFSRGGKTDVADGVSLCRHHHMLVHNNGWRITRDAGRYWLVPPPELDPAQRPRPAESRSPVLRRLLAPV